ncbi:hypothetical protein N9034_00550 [bacterium]|nr:hypothetical protein [bacterium]
MDNFDLQKYLASGKIHADNTILTEAKKQGYDDREDESLGARKGAEKGKKQSMKARRDDSYGKFGKRDAEKKGKNKINKESQEVDESALAVAAGVASVFGGAAAMAKIMDKLEAGDLGEKGKKVANVLAQLGKGAANRYNEGYSKPMYDEDDTNPMKEDARTDAEEEGYEDGFKDAKDDMKDAMSKMKVSELKAKIREDILSTLNEEEEVDVDIDVEDEVEVDAEADDIEIERKGVKAKVEVGLSPEEEIVQDSLKAAMDAAQALGSDKLADQIGNTITFFTRQFVVGDNTD